MILVSQDGKRTYVLGRDGQLVAMENGLYFETPQDPIGRFRSRAEALGELDRIRRLHAAGGVEIVRVGGEPEKEKAEEQKQTRKAPRDGMVIVCDAGDTGGTCVNAYVMDNKTYLRADGRRLYLNRILDSGRQQGFCLGAFESDEEAQAELFQITKAYALGDGIFRVGAPFER